MGASDYPMVGKACVIVIQTRISNSTCFFLMMFFFKVNIRGVFCERLKYHKDRCFKYIKKYVMNQENCLFYLINIFY